LEAEMAVMPRAGKKERVAKPWIGKRRKLR
jgi:hypothetical protein